MAIDFVSASSQSISRTTAPSLDAAYTLMGWFRPDAVNNNTFFHVGDSSNYYDTIQINSSANLQTEVFYPAATWTSNSNTTLSAGTWYHIALVRADGDTLYGYLNGVLDNTVSRTVSRGAANLLNVARLRNNIGSFEAYFDGRVVGLKAWSTNLSASEIMTEMHTLIPKKYTSLWAWWPLFSGSGVRARDYSVNGRTWTENGTLADGVGAPVVWGMFAPHYAPVAVAVGGGSILPMMMAHHG